MNDEVRARLAAEVRDLCLQELLEAYEQAGISGLCAEGRWEVAIGRVRALAGEEILDRLPRRENG